VLDNVAFTTTLRSFAGRLRSSLASATSAPTETGSGPLANPRRLFVALMTMEIKGAEVAKLADAALGERLSGVHEG
jgi:hypothetical protein